MRALLILLMLNACQRQGKIVGPSTIAKAVSTCQVSCRTVEDCRRIPSRDSDLSFQWLACENGLCVDVECTEDAQCWQPAVMCGADCQARSCSKNADCDYDFLGTFCLAGHCTAHDRKCTEHQCALNCGKDEDCDSRDRCLSGRCIRQPERPDPACNKDCACFADGDCPEYQSCRTGNVCRTYQTQEGSAAQGRTCSDDAVCARKYFFQDMLEAGLNEAMISAPGACRISCETDPALQQEFNTCGTSFVCKHFATDEPEFAGFAAPAMSEQRAACFPEACVTACTSSLAVCDDDADCKMSGETCTWPKPACKGVCVNTSCAACKTWLDVHRTRVCTSTPGTSVSIDVRRPD